MINSIPHEERVTVAVHDLASHNVDKSSPVAKFLKKPIEMIFGTQESGQKRPQELRRLNFCCKPGEILLILSPADTNIGRLLSILANRAPSSLEYTGAVLYNSSSGSSTKNKVAAVLEGDELDAHLSVHDSLKMAVELHLGKLATPGVQDMLKTFGLESVQRDTIGTDQDGVGPHARKCLRLAQELLPNPPLVVAHGMLDDATPVQAAEMMKLFRSLADGGHTVVLGTDEGMAQELFQQVDRVLLLSKGRVMYFGKADKAEEWFKAQGLQLPEGSSVPDFMVNLSDGAVADDPEDGEMARQDSLEVATQYLQQHPEGYSGGDVISGNDTPAARDVVSTKAAALQDAIPSAPVAVL